MKDKKVDKTKDMRLIFGIFERIRILIKDKEAKAPKHTGPLVVRSAKEFFDKPAPVLTRHQELKHAVRKYCHPSRHELGEDGKATMEIYELIEGGRKPTYDEVLAAAVEVGDNLTKELALEF